ncbi:MAG: alpha/beta hydrolase [Candidatus Omnitrophica bacterium]|nr:alpha/beta hydrolase [Candidatus Omnitrophota bacterium]
MRILRLILIFSILIFVYLKYFERKGIYYPTKGIEFTPTHIGLKYEDVFFNTDDGLKLNGWFIPAENPRATLLFCHGNAGNISHRIEIIEIFNKLELNVFIFDYRGYGRSQGSPSEEGLYRDAQAAYKYLLNRENIKKGAIVIYGKSIGANVAIDLASKVKPACLISESGFSSAYDMAKKLFPYLPIKWIITIKYDALTKIKNIPIPKLIIHSQDDEIIPFRLGKKLFDAAVQPKEFYQMRGGHNEAIFMAREEYGVKINNFLSRYLNGYSS